MDTYEVFHYKIGYMHGAVADYRRVTEEPGDIVKITRVDGEEMFIGFEYGRDGRVDGFSYATYRDGEDMECGGSVLHSDDQDHEQEMADAIIGWLDKCLRQ